MPQTTLHDMFVDEMRDIYYAEQLLTKALPKMIKAADSPDLRQALEKHLGETENQIERLEQAFSIVNERAKAKKCDGMIGILDEGNRALREHEEGPVLDAAIIGAAQRVEHYEAAVYGTLVAWAQTMGHNEVARLFQETLEEEKNADKTLSNLAEGGINQAANAGQDGSMEEDEEEDSETRNGRAGRSRSASAMGRSRSSGRSSDTRSRAAASRSGTANRSRRSR